MRSRRKFSRRNSLSRSSIIYFQDDATQPTSAPTTDSEPQALTVVDTWPQTAENVDDELA